MSFQDEKLYPLLAKAEQLNDSARDASKALNLAWKYLESAAETIKARASDIPPIQRRFK